MVADGSRTLYAGAFGKRDGSEPDVRVDSLFNIASMTKAVTTVATLQLVEQGKVDLSEPVARLLPRLANLDVLDGFDATGKTLASACGDPDFYWPIPRALLRLMGGQMFRYAPAKPGPLMFEPGTRWQYGQGVDWAGRLVEAISGVTLKNYFQQKILRPLGMEDTSYILPESKFDRLVSSYHRGPNGDLQQNERKLPGRPW